jgi:hypothetical protein
MRIAKEGFMEAKRNTPKTANRGKDIDHSKEE